MERRVDFWRDRRMLCGVCGHLWIAGLEWVDRWERAEERCPGCHMTCEQEDSPRVTVDPNDPALNDDQVARLFWYHTSTQPDWPTANFDPAADFTAETRHRMGGDEAVASWVARQRAKALHVGTYEAAVHNMLRRMRDQADGGQQFYLYRVHLKPSVVVSDGWLIDPSDWVGDVVLAEVCPAGIDVVRYLNYHEDPGGLSLALGRSAIASVRQIAVPLPGTWDVDWVRSTVAALEAASEIVVPTVGKFARFQRPSSPRGVLGRELGAELAGQLPVNLQHQFEFAAAFTEGDDPMGWAQRAGGLFALIHDPGGALTALGAQPFRPV